jgi:hypothetical protein
MQANMQVDLHVKGSITAGGFKPKLKYVNRFCEELTRRNKAEKYLVLYHKKIKITY